MTRSAARGLSLPFLLRRSLLHRRARTLAELVALTVSAAVATALLTLYVSINVKLHRQFRAFGANIVVTADATHGTSLPPDALAEARRAAGPDANVVPFAYAIAEMSDGKPIVVAGTDLDAARAMNPWWQVTHWPAGPSDNPAKPIQALTGIRAQRALGAADFTLTYNGKPMQFHTAGTLRTGDAEDSRIYIPLSTLETWTGTTPGTLQIQATGSTAQVQAVIDRLKTTLPGTDVHAIHQLVEAEANVVSRTRELMLGSLLVISLTVAICVLATLTASVFERRRDFAVMKALGASQRDVRLMFLLEAIALALGGLICGYILGCAIAYAIGEWNFHTAIAPVWHVIPWVALLNVVVAALAAAVPLRILQNLKPAALLRGE